MLDAGAGHDVEALLFLFFLMLLVRGGRGALRRLGRGRRMREVHGDHPRLPIGARPGGSQLHEALSAHQIGLEGRPERIAFPAHAIDLGAGLTHEGVVNGRHQRSLRRQVGVNLVQSVTKEQRRIHPVP